MSVFICHSSADKPFVRRLADALRRKGMTVWIDEAEIKVGDSLIKKIEEGIVRSEYLAVVLSPESVKSEWVRKELETAMIEEIRGKRVTVLPILLKKCGIPGFLSGKKYADFSGKGSFQTGLDELLEVIFPKAVRKISSEKVEARKVKEAAFKFGMFKKVYDFAYSPSGMDKTRSEAEKFANDWVRKKSKFDFKSFIELYRFVYAPNNLDMTRSEAERFAFSWLDRPVNEFEMFKKAYDFAYSSGGMDKTRSDSLQFAYLWIREYSHYDFEKFKELYAYAYSSTGMDKTRSEAEEFAFKQLSST